jgi:hypothetical protein
MAATLATLLTPVTAGASRNIDLEARARAASARPLSHAIPLLVGIAAALATLFVKIDVGVATAHPGAAQPAVIIDRTLKGDRLFRPSSINLNAGNQSRGINLLGAPTLDLDLPDGCEALVSLLTRSPLRRVAGRCVS